MQTYLTMILTAMNWFPGVKTRVAAVAALLLAIVAAWNSAAPAIGVDFIIAVPEWLTAATLALLGVGAANQPVNNPPKP